MKKNIDFFYKIDKKAGFAEDDVLKALAELLNIDVSLLTIVTREEYLTETKED